MERLTVERAFGGRVMYFIRSYPSMLLVTIYLAAKPFGLLTFLSDYLLITLVAAEAAALLSVGPVRRRLHADVCRAYGVSYPVRMTPTKWRSGALVRLDDGSLVSLTIPSLDSPVLLKRSGGGGGGEWPEDPTPPGVPDTVPDEWVVEERLSRSGR